MARSPTLTHPASPPNLSYVVLALFAVPALWGVRLVVNFGLVSHYCFPSGVRRGSLPGSFDWLWPTLLGIDLFTIVIAAAAFVVSYRIWRITTDASITSRAPSIEIGEDRTRFLSFWGLLTSALLAVAIGFDIVALWIVPLCG
jgi:hypothetical protein